MVISNGSAKKRGRPGGSAKEEKRSTPPQRCRGRPGTDASTDADGRGISMRMEESPPVWFGYVQSLSCRIWRLMSRLKSVPFGCRHLPLSFSLPFPARGCDFNSLKN